MRSSIFSTYRTGENRVTASILAVLRSLALNRIERLLGALTEQDFTLVRFENQRGQGAAGVPDALVQSSCRILIETKLKQDAVDLKQLKRHLDRFDSAHEDFKCLLVLTPDEARPNSLADLSNDRLTWASFAALHQAIEELLVDEQEVISEREAFLLRELQVMLEEEGLIHLDEDTVIVAARHAWPEYNELNAYICQPDRFFRPVKFLGFYTAGQIQPRLPRIKARQDHVRLQSGLHEGELGRVVERLLEAGREVGSENQIFLLSSPEDPETFKLKAPIKNNLKSDDGRTTAFTQGQRYARHADLDGAKQTSDLFKQAGRVPGMAQRQTRVGAPRPQNRYDSTS